LGQGGAHVLPLLNRCAKPLLRSAAKAPGLPPQMGMKIGLVYVQSGFHQICWPFVKAQLHWLQFLFRRALFT